MASFSKGTSFTDGVTGDVTAAKLHALVDAATPVAGLVTDRTAKTSVVGADLVLLSDSADSNNLKKVSITNFANNLPTAVITNGTVTTLNSTTGTIAGANITTGTIATGTFGTTTSTAATITTGTIPTLVSTTSITSGTGSASTPAIRPTGDTNTGLFFPAADTIAFSEGGTESMRIDSSGNVILTGNKSLISRGAGGVSTNSAIGDGALQANTTGHSNTANGVNALYSNTTSNNNTANGASALYSNTTGNSNTANGASALYSNTTGNYNTANGVNALYSNTTSNNNTANGASALYSNTTGNSNTANGLNALYSNTTGFSNTANGVSALVANTTGYNNTANGVNALYSNTTGNTNTAIGFQAGYGATGTNANTTGSNNTFIGNEAVGSSATASNVITLGNSAIATLRCQVTTITALSDRRDKKDIVPLDKGLGLINALNPVSFVWNMRDGKKVGIPEIGFIAQELEEAQKQSGLTVPNLVYADNPERLEASPSTLIPILVRAVQELSEKVSQLEAKLKE